MFGMCAVAGLAPACGRQFPEHGTLIDDPQAAPALRLTDAQGRTFDLAARHGQPTFVFFGYTHCPDACPTTLADWAHAKSLLGAKGARVRFVFVSVDPARDTPRIAEDYARRFDPSFTGLVVPDAELAGIAAAWHFAVERDEMPGMKPGEYGVTHPAGVFFVDDDGRMKFVFAAGATPAEIASDLGRLP